MSEGHTPAFPVPTATWQSHGMTKREAFAMAAMQGILAGICSRMDAPTSEWMDVPAFAVRIADRLIEAVEEMP